MKRVLLAIMAVAFAASMVPTVWAQSTGQTKAPKQPSADCPPGKADCKKAVTPRSSSDNLSPPKSITK